MTDYELEQLVKSVGQLREVTSALLTRIQNLERRWTEHMVNTETRQDVTMTPPPQWEETCQT